MTGTQAPTINSSYEYGKFRLMVGNRRVNANHVKELKLEMQCNPELLAANPILVNEHHFIIDGQHRFEAAKELRRELFYIVSDGTTIDQTRHLNTTQRRWSLLDFAHSYADSGHEAYITFLEFHKEFPLIQVSILQIYMTSKMNHDLTRAFRRGEFEVFNKEIARKNLEKLTQIITTTHTKINTPMASSLLDLMVNNPDFDIDVFLHKLEFEGARSLFESQVTVKGCLRSIEATYNFNSKVVKRFY